MGRCMSCAGRWAGTPTLRRFVAKCASSGNWAFVEGHASDLMDKIGANGRCWEIRKQDICRTQTALTRYFCWNVGARTME